jgi:hypothetical protein
MDEWVWSNGGMMLTGENRSSWMNTCGKVTLSTTDLTLKELGSKPSLIGKTPVNNRLTYA